MDLQQHGIHGPTGRRGLFATLSYPGLPSVKYLPVGDPLFGLDSSFEDQHEIVSQAHENSLLTFCRGARWIYPFDPLEEIWHATAECQVGYN